MTEDKTKNRKPKTAIVAFAQALQGGEFDFDLIEKKDNVEVNEELKINRNNKPALEANQLYQMASGKKIRFNSKTVPSEKCCVWDENIRDQNNLNEESLNSLIDSIRMQGQAVPILVRPCNKDGYQYETIYGSRRLAACKRLGIQVKVLEGDISDQDAIFLMAAENMCRDDVTSYERAITYNKWLEKGIFSSQEDLAKKLCISRQWVIKVMGLLKISQRIIDNIPDLRQLTVKTGDEIRKITQSSSENTDLFIDVLMQRNEKIFNLSNVVKKYNLLHKSKQKILSGSASEKGIKVMTSSSGEAMLKVNTSTNGKVIMKTVDGLSPQQIGKLIDLIEKAVKRL